MRRERATAAQRRTVFGRAKGCCEYHEVPLFHPRQQLWSEHFAWNDDFTLIVGLTPIGRATIQALHLNRSELVNLRSVLHQVGQLRPSTPRTLP